jgi:hypothetical protein
VRLGCQPEEHPLCAALAAAAAGAALELQLARYLCELTLCLDDLDADERIWLTFGTAERGEGGEASVGARRTLTLYLHPDHVLKDRPLAVLAPHAAIWEMRRQPQGRGAEPAWEVSRPKIERFLYHQFLFIRDLCQGRLDPRRIPRDLAAAFQEAWAVTIDGRLRQARLPGYSAAERRRRFSRFFAASGVILPDHWRIFHDLWEDAEIDQEQLLRALERLPRSRRPRQ